MATLIIDENAANYQWLADLMPDAAKSTPTRLISYAGGDVILTLAGESWRNGVPTAGVITSVVIQTYSTFGIPAPIQIASFRGLSVDLVSFWYEALGYPTGNGGSVSGRPENALSLLLQGDDTINGSDHSDDIYEGAGTGNDLIRTWAGNDYIWGLLGNDTIMGGKDYDTLTYEATFYDINAYKGVVVDVATGRVEDPWGDVDQVSEIEEFRGTGYDDVFNGDATNNLFHGYRGADSYLGGGGFDVVAYWRDSRFGATYGIRADLAKGTVIDGYGQRDRLTDIDRIDATEFGDTLKGGAANDVFAGGPGKDAYDGRGGFDTVTFSWSGPTPVTGTVINLGLAGQQVLNDGFGNREGLTSIEAVVGNHLGDAITGNGANNHMEGARGDDTLVGGSGDDWIQGDLGRDYLTGGIGSDVFVYTGTQDPAPWGDSITDFVSGTDTFRFETADFSGMDTLVRFRNGSNAGSVGSWFFFQKAVHGLFWDADGARGLGAPVLVATLVGVSALTAADILLV